MASSLDVDTIVSGVTGLMVPFLADYAALVLVNEDGSVRVTRSASARPSTMFETSKADC